MARKIQRLVIHCTATPEGLEVTAADIRRWHTSQPPLGRGWRQVGYTDLIHLDGRVERLVPNNEDAYVDGWEITNGAKGYNETSRHIVYAGGLEATTDSRGRIVPKKDRRGNTISKDTRTAAQKRALREYVLDFHKRFPLAEIVGHNQLAVKDCPCFDVPSWLKEIGIN